MTGQLQFPLPVPGTVNPDAGERAKTAGMAVAAANTAPDWADACDEAIRVMAARGVIFQAADLIAEGLVDEPEHPNRWGAAFGRADRAGVIQACGYAQSKRATVHKSICRTWIGTGRAAA
jgi:hypothetical protein